jgi:hypothetical protein
MTEWGTRPEPDEATDEPIFASDARGAAVAAAPIAPEPVLPGAAGGIAGGLVGGLVTAVVAAGLWYAVVSITNWQIGLVAIAVGWLVGTGVRFGAGGRGSVPLAAIGGILTLGSLVVSEYLIIHHWVSEDIGAANVIDVIQPPSFIIEVVAESVTADPLTLVFWAIALFQGAVIPLRPAGSGE